MLRMDIHFIIRNTIYPFGFVFVCFALAIIVIGHKQYIHYISALVLADFGVMCIAGGICVYAQYRGLAVNLAVFGPMLFLAPSGCAFALDCFGARKASRFFQWIINIGTVIAAMVCEFLIYRDTPWPIVFAVVYGWLCATFLTLCILEGHDLRPVRKMPKGLYQFYLLLCGDVVLIAGMLFCQLYLFYPGLYSLWVLQILSVLATALIAFHSPESYHLIESAAENIRYERSSLCNVNVPEVVRKLDFLMEAERLYLDPDLRQEDVAKRLGVTTYQLSELINQRLGLNFSGYVNNRRLALAKTLLVEMPEESVLHIAFESGFNSKSVFNATFRKATGFTPTEFRKANLP